MPERANPFPGARPFRPEEARLFFGRDREARQLVSLVFAKRVLILHAPSGAGKSSFVGAKLVPSLTAEGFQVLGPARVPAPTAVDRASPGNLFTRNAIAEFDPAPAIPRAAATLQQHLQAMRRLHSEDGDVLPRVLILDQFEEIFRVPPERREDRAIFFEELAAALNTDRQLRLLLVLREDFLAELESHIVVLPDRPALRYRLDRLNRDAALLAITRPVEAAGRSFIPGVAELLVDKLLASPGEGEFVEPVQLQVVCHSLWASLPGDVSVITGDHIQAFGDVDQTLAAFYEGCLRVVLAGDPVRESVLRDWFESTLITPQHTRGTAFRGPADTAGIPNRVVENLEDQHLIRGEFRANARWYELTHDRFIDPILLANQRWREQRPVAEQTYRWLEQLASAVPLRSLDEAELARAEQWFAGPNAADFPPSQPVHALMEISRTEHTRRRERGLYLEQQAAAARKLRILAAACIVIAVLAVGGALWAIWEQGKAGESEKAALDARTKAEESAIRERAKSQELRAANRTLADQKSSLDRAYNNLNSTTNELKRQKQIVDQANRRLATLNGDLTLQKEELDASNKKLTATNLELDRQKKSAETAAETANLAEQKATLALEEQKKARAEAERLKRVSDSSALSDTALFLTQLDPRRAFSDALNAVKYLLDSDHFATGKGLLALRDALPGAMISASSPLPGSGQLTGLAFGPEGESIQAIFSHGTRTAWSQGGIIPSTQPSAPTSAPGLPDTTAISADGTKWVMSRIDRNLRTWLGIMGKGVIEEIDQLAPARNGVHRTHRHALLSMAVSPDGKHVAGGSSFGYRYLWNFQEHSRWRTPGVFNWLRIVIAGAEVRPATAFAFAPDPKKELFAIGSADGSVEVRDFKGKLLLRWKPHDGPVLGLAFSPNGLTVASAGRDRTVAVRAFNPPQPIQLTGHRDAVLAVAFSPDDAMLIATGGQDGIVRLWRLSDDRGSLILELPRMNGYVSAIAFNAAKHLMAAASVLQVTAVEEGAVKHKTWNRRLSGPRYGRGPMRVAVIATKSGY